MALTSSLAGLLMTMRPSRLELTLQLRLAVAAQTLLLPVLLGVGSFLGSGLILGQGIAALAAGQWAQHPGHHRAFLLTCLCGAAALVVALSCVRPGFVGPDHAVRVRVAEPSGIAAEQREGA